MDIIVHFVSYLAFLLLTMQISITGIIQTVIFLIIGLVLFIWKKPWKKSSSLSTVYFLLAEISVIDLGARFYKRWLPSSKISSLATMLHMSNKLLIGITAVALCLCSGYFIANVLKYIDGLLNKRNNSFALNIIFAIIISVATVACAQLMLGLEIFSMGIINFIWGCTIVCTAILLLYCLFGEIGISTLLGSGVFIIISIANVYVYSFRARLFMPVDVFSFSTAMNVIDNYSLFPIPSSIIFNLGNWIRLFVICVLFIKREGKITTKQRISTAVCVLIGIVSICAYTSDLHLYHWNAEGATYNGYILDFVANFKEAYVSKPDGYNIEDIDELAVSYMQNITDENNNNTSSPHIIVIMDEAFSDLSVVGEISTDTEVIPFISSLKENTISGYTLVSVYGGNTANSEYEFLTGNSMAWMSSSAVPYQQYVRSKSYSMVSYLKTNYNYSCIALHPYTASGWNRPNTYGYFGFDECYFIDDFPKENYIRQYISDKEMFEKIVDTYENRNDEPLFIFGVTMQNHGSYKYSGENFTQTVSLVGYDTDYSDVEQYLSLIHETDKAVEYLISYFENADDDVIIVFFGDHQPSINSAFYDEIAENSDNLASMQQNKFKVPFFIWANYDIDEQYIDCVSLNYLSSYVYEAAGMSLPLYNEFLSAMEEVIPAINAYGFYTKDCEEFLSFDEADDEESMWLNLYEKLQYNNVFDDENRNVSFFPTLE